MPSASSTGPASASRQTGTDNEQEADPALRHRLDGHCEPRVPRADDRQPPAVPQADQRARTSRRRSSHGKDVWHKYNCINCHTLFGEGAYYAPDLTKITQHRGEQYLQAYMRDPSKFYDEQRHRRLMPKQDLSDEEITDLIAFLDWVSKVDNQGWPPRPILVTGATIPGTDLSARSRRRRRRTRRQQLPPGARPVTSGAGPDGAGRRRCSARRRRRATPATRWRRASTWPGPSLAGVATRAAADHRLARLQGQGEGCRRLHPRVDRRAERATSCRARCTRPTACRSCPTPTART